MHFALRHFNPLLHTTNDARPQPRAGVSRPKAATRQRSPPAWYTKIMSRIWGFMVRSKNGAGGRGAIPLNSHTYPLPKVVKFDHFETLSIRGHILVRILDALAIDPYATIG